MHTYCTHFVHSQGWPRDGEETDHLTRSVPFKKCYDTGNNPNISSPSSSSSSSPNKTGSYSAGNPAKATLSTPHGGDHVAVIETADSFIIVFRGSADTGDFITDLQAQGGTGQKSLPQALFGDKNVDAPESFLVTMLA